jgi:hypothetical protein
VMPLGSFSKRDECVFRFTYWGHQQRFELAGMDSAFPTGGWSSGAAPSECTSLTEIQDRGRCPLRRAARLTVARRAGR